MKKDKLIKGVVWLSAFAISVIISALSLFIGFNNYRYGNNTILIIGIMTLPVVFFCAYKGLKLILDALLNE